MPTESFYDAVRERAIQNSTNVTNTDSAFGDLANGRSSLIKLARESENLAEAINKLGEKAFKDLQSKIGKLNINSGKAAEKLSTLIIKLWEQYQNEEQT